MPSKVGYFSRIEEIFPYCPDCPKRSKKWKSILESLAQELSVSCSVLHTIVVTKQLGGVLCMRRLGRTRCPCGLVFAHWKKKSNGHTRWGFLPCEFVLFAKNMSWLDFLKYTGFNGFLKSYFCMQLLFNDIFIISQYECFMNTVFPHIVSSVLFFFEFGNCSQFK